MSSWSLSSAGMRASAFRLADMAEPAPPRTARHCTARTASSAPSASVFPAPAPAGAGRGGAQRPGSGRVRAGVGTRAAEAAAAAGRGVRALLGEVSVWALGSRQWRREERFHAKRPRGALRRGLQRGEPHRRWALPAVTGAALLPCPGGGRPALRLSPPFCGNGFAVLSFIRLSLGARGKNRKEKSKAQDAVLPCQASPCLTPP